MHRTFSRRPSNAIVVSTVVDVGEQSSRPKNRSDDAVGRPLTKPVADYLVLEDVDSDALPPSKVDNTVEVSPCSNAQSSISPVTFANTLQGDASHRPANTGSADLGLTLDLCLSSTRSAASRRGRYVRQYLR